MALIECPECGKSISDKADACIHCGYPVARYQPEQGEAEAETVPEMMEPAAQVRKEPSAAEQLFPETAEVPAQPGEKADRVRRYNARLAITAFIGGTGSVVLSMLSNIMLGSLGTYALAGASVGNSAISLLSRGLVILVIIAFFCRKRILNFIAIGYEVTIALLLIAIPGSLIRLFGGNEDIIAYSMGYLRTTGIIWIMVTGLCVLLGCVIRKKKMMFYFIFLAGARVLALLLGWMLMYSIGSIGAAFGNLAQPFAMLLPMLMFNPDIPGQKKTRNS